VPHGGNGRCLEIGPGQGIELRALRWIGWNAEGLEIDPAGAAVAERVSGCEVHIGAIIDAPFSPGTFELIYLHHVLEHVPDLLPSLERILQLLAPGGRAVMVYPNPNSLVCRLWGKFSPAWDAPRHFVLPAPRAIEELLRSIGFQHVWMRTLSRRSVAHYKRALHYKALERLRHRRTGFRFSDVLLQLIEWLLVTGGVLLGEEVLVVAAKQRRLVGC
jgi:SAM-dependent methyltransferase